MFHERPAGDLTHGTWDIIHIIHIPLMMGHHPKFRHWVGQFSLWPVTGCSQTSNACSCQGKVSRPFYFCEYCNVGLWQSVHQFLSHKTPKVNISECRVTKKCEHFMGNTCSITAVNHIKAYTRYDNKMLISLLTDCQASCKMSSHSSPLKSLQRSVVHSVTFSATELHSFSTNFHSSYDLLLAYIWQTQNT